MNGRKRKPILPLTLEEKDILDRLNQVGRVIGFLSAVGTFAILSMVTNAGLF